jgi:hypothetical protein
MRGLILLLSGCLVDPKISELRRMDCEEVVNQVETYEDAKWYLENYLRESDDFKREQFGFCQVHELRKGDCSEYSVAAAALLRDDYFPSGFLTMSGGRAKDKHVVFVYKDNEIFKTLGITSRDKSEGYGSLDEIAQKYNAETGYTRFSLYEMGNIMNGSFVDFEDGYKSWGMNY